MQIKGALAISLLLCLFPDGYASAAVRVCKPMVIGELASDRDRLIARRRALANWTRRARAHGRAFTAWRLAGRKAIRCVKSDDAGYRCAAAGQPCRVRQKAPRKRLPRSRGAEKST